MGKTVIDCGYINVGGDEGLEKLVHTGSGRLLGILASYKTSAVTIIFYDATAATPGKEILAIDLNAGVSPFYCMFPREQSLTFQTGLYVETNSAQVAIWAILYS
jgi:hypothetical protein